MSGARSGSSIAPASASMNRVACPVVHRNRSTPLSSRSCRPYVIVVKSMPAVRAAMARRHRERQQEEAQHDAAPAPSRGREPLGRLARGLGCGRAGCRAGGEAKDDPEGVGRHRDQQRMTGRRAADEKSDEAGQHPDQQRVVGAGAHRRDACPQRGADDPDKREQADQSELGGRLQERVVGVHAAVGVREPLGRELLGLKVILVDPDAERRGRGKHPERGLGEHDAVSPVPTLRRPDRRRTDGTSFPPSPRPAPRGR